MNNYKLTLWNRFCEKHKIAETGVPLFSTNSDRVNFVEVGKAKRRHVLQRSPLMEKMVITEANKVIEDFQNGQEQYEGLIYMMYKLDNGQIIPLYIGKTEKYGKGGGNLSENIKNIANNKGKFCRWGHQYDYHIGDLSAIVCNSHPAKKQRPKYKKWGDRLFKECHSEIPCLKQPIYFWTTAWEKGSTGIWEDFGPTNLTFLEYLLIGVVSDLFPDDLLNDEGVNRSRDVAVKTS